MDLRQHKSYFWHFVMQNINSNVTLLYLYFAKSMFSGLGSAMVLNAFNIAIVRMQNLDYKHNRSIYYTAKDLVMIDKHRMFYRGLVPITIAGGNLSML
jgi:hypothetical protein